MPWRDINELIKGFVKKLGLFHQKGSEMAAKCLREVFGTQNMLITCIFLVQTEQTLRIDSGGLWRPSGAGGSLRVR